jgi:hypothetical protein
VVALGSCRTVIVPLMVPNKDFLELGLGASMGGSPGTPEGDHQEDAST